MIRITMLSLKMKNTSCTSGLMAKTLVVRVHPATGLLCCWTVVVGPPNILYQADIFVGSGRCTCCVSRYRYNVYRTTMITGPYSMFPMF